MSSAVVTFTVIGSADAVADDTAVVGDTVVVRDTVVIGDTVVVVADVSAVRSLITTHKAYLIQAMYIYYLHPHNRLYKL